MHDEKVYIYICKFYFIAINFLFNEIFLTSQEKACTIFYSQIANEWSFITFVTDTQDLNTKLVLPAKEDYSNQENLLGIALYFINWVIKNFIS